jgi:integrase
MLRHIEMHDAPTIMGKNDMSPKLRRILLEHKIRSRTNELDLVFCTSTGTPINPENFARDFWRPSLKATGLEDLRFHDLRHCYASLKIAQGEGIFYVQRQLGHASIQITLDTYSHLMKETNPAAAQKTDQLIFGTA